MQSIPRHRSTVHASSDIPYRLNLEAYWRTRRCDVRLPLLRTFK